MKKLISLGIVLLSLFGCGASAPQASLELRLKMPAALAYQSARYRRFLGRATHLEIALDPPGAKPQVYSFPVLEWEGGIEIPELPAASTFHLRVRIWDLRRDGTARAEPALKGSILVKWDGLRLESQVVTVPLRLEVSVAEYD